MVETPRQYKKRIDEKRKKNAENRDKLIQQIEKYELVDEDFKAKTKQEILDNFEKNLNAEKNGELYLTVGKELEKIDVKYKELEELKENLKIKKQESSDLEKQLLEQNVDGTDKTTLKLQKLNLKKIKTKLETVEKEIKELEKEIENRENELKGIEETYGKKEEVVSSDDKDTNKEGTSPSKESTKKDTEKKPETLQEYKERVLREKGKIEHTKGEILKLLNEGTGIDESLKQKIESKVSDTFAEYDAEQEGTLRMKAAKYLEKRDDILNGNASEEKTREIGGKIAYKERNKEGKWCIIRGDEQYSDWFEEVGDPVDVWGEPAFKVVKDGKQCIFRGKEQYSDWGEWVRERGNQQSNDWCEGAWYIKEIGGKPVFNVINDDGKWALLRGNQQCGDWYDNVGYPADVSGKPAFRAKNHDGKWAIFRGNQQCGDWFDDVGEMTDIGGKLVFRAKNDDGKWTIFQGNQQCGDWFDDVGEMTEIGGKPTFRPKNDDGKWAIFRGNQQCGDWYDNVWHPVDVLGKPAFEALKNGWAIFRGNQQCCDWGEEKINKLGNYENELKNYIQAHCNDAEKENTSNNNKETEAMEDSPREKREKIILDWYQKKLNRDELLKIISGTDGINEDTKNKLEKQILHSFYDEFKKVISDEDFQEWDKQYRTLKKTQRKNSKKIKEIDSGKGDSMSEIKEIDARLYEIANSAMDLEDESRRKILKKGKLNKAKDEWNDLETRQNEIIEGVRKLNIEKKKLELDLSNQNKKYGVKKNRPVIKGKNIKGYGGVGKQDLKQEHTLKGYKEKYVTMIANKEKYMKDLLKQIESAVLGIDDETKKEVIEIIRSEMTKQIENLKQGDELLKLANETEKWLKENLETMMQDMEDLSLKIKEKEAEIAELKSRGKGNNSDEIFGIKEQELDLRNELVELESQYEAMKSKIDEDLRKYNGSNYEEKKVEIKLKKVLGVDTLAEVKKCGVIGGEPCFTVKNGEGDYCVCWGDWHSNRCNEIGEIKDLGGKPCFKVKDSDGNYRVYWGDWHSDGYKEMGEIKDVGGEPCFTVKNGEGDYRLYWGGRSTDGYKEMGEIKNVGGEPCFTVKNGEGDYCVCWGDWHSNRCNEIGEIKDIGGKPCFKVKDSDGYYRVYWGHFCYRYGYDGYKEIGEIKDIGGKPCFKVKDWDGTYGVYWGDRGSDRYKEIYEIKDIGGKPCFRGRAINGTYGVYWGGRSTDGYKEIGEIKDIGGEPCFTVKNGEGDYCVYWGELHTDGYREIGEIKDIGGKPCFTVKNSDGDYCVYWGELHTDGYKEIGEIKDAGGKPSFRVKKSHIGFWKLKTF